MLIEKSLMDALREFINGEPYITLTLNEDGVAEVYDDTYDVTIHCESEEEQGRVVGILERYQGWIQVEDTERTPENESYVLVSFSNFPLPDIARYEENDEGGTYYPGDDEKSYLNYGFFVNAWMPLPEPYRPKDIPTAKMCGNLRFHLGEDKKWQSIERNQLKLRQFNGQETQLR